MVFALASRALRSTSVRPALALAGARRGYAEAVSNKMKLSFVLPHEVSCAVVGLTRLFTTMRK